MRFWSISHSSSASRVSQWVHPTRVLCLVVILFSLSSKPVGAQESDTQESAAIAISDSLPIDADPSSVLEQLVQRVAQQVVARYERPWGRVVERRRNRVYIVPQGTVPEKGDHFLVMRSVPGMEPARERLICKLKVQRVADTLIECKEVDRTGKEHAEEGDVVREENSTVHALLSPCISAIDLAPVIPQVVGEYLRLQLQNRPTLSIQEDLELEKEVKAAYWSGTMADFLARQSMYDVVLVPMLLRSQERLILNVEYFSVQRRAAVAIDVGSMPLDEMLLSWLRAGRTRDNAPPGYRSLPAQTYDWPLLAMKGLSGGRLVTVQSDSVRLLEFAYPGLRLSARAALPRRDRVRQQPYMQLVHGEDLNAAAEFVTQEQKPVPLDISPLQVPPDVLWMTSDERRPMILDFSGTGVIQVDSQSASVVEGLRLLWLVLEGPPQLGHRWWPTPGGKRTAIYPQFQDVDGDGSPDILWSDDQGKLQLRRRHAEQPESRSGFGDVKSIQPAQKDQSNAVVWLTDPVWGGQSDRLTASQFNNGRLRTVWRSKRFAHTIVAIASVDLNSDGAVDLVVAEQLPRGSRLHLFLALPGESTATRGGPWSE